MHLRHRLFEPAADLDDDALLLELQRLIGGPLATRVDPPECKPGEPWLQRGWLVAAHGRTRQWRGDTDHLSYNSSTKKQLLGALGAAYGFDAESVAKSSDERVEIEAVYEGLRKEWEHSDRTEYRRRESSLSG